MSNYYVKLTPGLINPASEGSLDSSILDGKSLQRTLNMCEVDNNGTKKMISAKDGGEFNDTTFQNNDAVGTFETCIGNSIWCAELAQCIDLNTDADNCGECGNRCGENAICINGECVGSPTPTPTATIAPTPTPTPTPIVSNINAPETYTEDTTLNLTDIVISNSLSTVTATLILSNVNAGSLSTSTAGIVTSTFNQGTGVWTANGNVSNVNSLLAGVIFTPAANFNSNFIISVSISDGVHPAITGSKAITGIAVNDAPVLDASRTPVLSSISVNSADPVGVVGTLIASLVDTVVPAGGVDNVSDIDSGALLGVAITNSDSSNGTWFYSINNGVTWSSLGAVSGSSARLLAADSNTRLYFKPNTDFSGSIISAITFKAWDKTSGANGGLADTTTSGGTTAFSTSSDTAGIMVI